MKIESITLHHISMPLIAPFETSFGRETDRQCIVITLQSEGLTGYGECVASREPGYNYETTGTAWHILKDFVAPLILGKDVTDALDFQKRVEGIRGHHLAKAGMEMAIWDLLGKRDGKSLKEMFGGERDKVEVGVLDWDSENQPRRWCEPLIPFWRKAIAASRSRSSRGVKWKRQLPSERNIPNCVYRWTQTPHIHWRPPVRSNPSMT